MQSAWKRVSSGFWKMGVISGEGRVGG